MRKKAGSAAKEGEAIIHPWIKQGRWDKAQAGSSEAATSTIRKKSAQKFDKKRARNDQRPKVILSDQARRDDGTSDSVADMVRDMRHIYRRKIVVKMCARTRLPEPVGMSAGLLRKKTGSECSTSTCRSRKKWGPGRVHCRRGNAERGSQRVERAHGGKVGRQWGPRRDALREESRSLQRRRGFTSGASNLIHARSICVQGDRAGAAYGPGPRCRCRKYK